MKVRGNYHTIIFAPDTLGDDGPQVQMPNGSLGGTGTQTTLPVSEGPVLFDHRGETVNLKSARSIGFRARG